MKQLIMLAAVCLAVVASFAINNKTECEQKGGVYAKPVMSFRMECLKRF